MISRAGKATGKNKYLMNVAMKEGDPFWLDFENGVLEWETNEDDQTATNEDPEVSLLMDSSNDQLDEAKKRELQSWVEHQVYTQVPDQGQPKILTRWVYTNKESNGKQTLKARLVAKGFQDKDACNVRNDSPPSRFSNSYLNPRNHLSNFQVCSLKFFLFLFPCRQPFNVAS